MKNLLLKQSLSAGNLNQAWKKVKHQHTPWSATISRKELDWNLLQHILEMRESVLAGHYRPLPLRRYTLKKPDGSNRIISAQYLQDKLLQRAILQILEPKAEQLFHEDSFAYRPKRGVFSAMQRVRERVKCGQYWLVDADIKQFFDCIPHRYLSKILYKFIKDRACQRLFQFWLKQGTHHNSLLGTRRGISQGAVLSPLMCNLYLHQFDTQLAKKNIPFVRFADDFLLFCTSKIEAKEALSFAEEQLKKLDLDIHPHKTRIVRSSPRIKFLGENLPKA